VQVEFLASGETRITPLKMRPQTRPLSSRRQAEGSRRPGIDVTEVIEKQGLLVYVEDGRQLPEALLKDSLGLHGPEERLFAGRFDAPNAFELRRRTLDLLHRSRKSPVRGFIGGRIDLIPHQLYIAQEVANVRPRASCSRMKWDSERPSKPA